MRIDQKPNGEQYITDLSIDSREVFDKDKLFKKFIETLPEEEAELVKNIFENPTIFENMINQLSPEQRTIIISLLTSSDETSSQAIDLFRQCRFAEARSKLEQCIVIYSEARTKLEQSIPLSGSIELNNGADLTTSRAIAIFHNLLGTIEWSLGNTEASAHHHHEALLLANETCDLDMIAKSLLGLGNYFCEVGDYEQGLDCCQHAAGLLNGQDDRWHLSALIMSALSKIYSGIGQKEEALSWATKAVAAAKDTESKIGLASSLNMLGITQIDADMLESAATTFKEGVVAAQNASDSHLEAAILANYARCLLEQSYINYDEIELLLDRLTELTKDSDGLPLEALTLDASGWLSLARGSIESAIDSFLQLSVIEGALGTPLSQADTLLVLAWLHRDFCGELAEATSFCRQAIDILESIRERFQKDSHRIIFAGSTSPPYAFMVQTLLALSKPDEAFEYVERNKSRALLDLLHVPFKTFLAGCKDPGAIEWQRLSALLDEIGEIHCALENMHDPEAGNDFPGRDENQRDNLNITPFLERLAGLEHEVTVAFSGLAKIDPETASLLKVIPSTAPEAKEYLDENTGILSLYQTESTLHLFLLGYDCVTNISDVALDGNQAAGVVSEILNGIFDTKMLPVRSHDFHRQVHQPLSRLYDILIRPIRTALSRYKRIIISPHFFWHYFPFHALLDKTTGEYLCDQIEVGYCPSASILKQCRSKVKTGRERALILSRGRDDLPYLQEESLRVAAAFGQCGTVYHEHEANLSRSESGDEFDVIHLACHGFFNDRQPLLSGFDLPPGPTQHRQTFVGDLFRARLNCSLVTVSSCESGLSQFTQADELVGLSRAILHAGAASTMLSLWKVADASTCLFMENFYLDYVQDKHSKTRSHQLAMQFIKSNNEYAHPYYWAPFVVIGDWR
jgi:tetratricopeptide (TPR) repeat protein